LQHEFESAIAKISTLEGELEKARDHVRTSQKEHADHARSMAKLEAEKIRLQEELLQEKQRLAKYRVTEVGQHQDDLRMAELRAEQACSKQREREQDLWDVIEQYKELAELNAEQQAHMNQVERELQLTNRVKIQRRDLVYEYRKMEKGTLH
jgi:DNA-directed RNA polymerase subunit F